MTTITHLRWHEMDVEDRRDVRENLIVNKVTLKTSDRVTWTILRTLPGIPQWSQPHPTEGGFYLDFIKPTHKSRLVWELECDFTPFPGGQVDPDPLARPTVVTFSSSLVDQDTLSDADGKPIVNRAGEFITGLTKKVPLIEYTFRKNMASDPAWIQTHVGCVNGDEVKLRGRSWKPKTLLLSAASGGDFITENRSTYTEISGTILADARGWTQDVWNRGTVQLKKVKRLINGVSKEIWIQVPIVTGDPPEAVSEPVPLDEKGFQIQEPFPGGNATDSGQTFIQLHFDLQRSAAFAELPLR